MSKSKPLFSWLNERAAGLLLHPTSLPGRQGIGTLGAEAFALIDFLKSADLCYWQILPLNPTGFGDSPYSSFSAFAGNPYLIDLVALRDLGLLRDDELEEIRQIPTVRVDFGRLYHIKWPLLRLAQRRFLESGKDELPGYGSFKAFKEEQATWLEPFVHFMAIKAQHNGAPWYMWEPAVESWKAAQKADLEPDVTALAEAHRFYQYVFFSQWSRVRDYAKEAGISIIGDVPIFVSHDSADVWGEPEIFQLDADLNPVARAGVPPDYFSPDGQLWGNPLYDWKQLKSTGYDWWMRRLEANYAMLDVVRLDHFRGFSAYWRVPATAKTAKNGTWEKGPGLDFFKAIRKRFPDARMIAEDLGEIDEPVYQLVEDTGLPGMAVMQFGFDRHPENMHLPHNMRPLQVAYTGTHDNDTTRSWYDKSGASAQDQVRRYLRIDGRDVAWDFIRELYHSVPYLAVIPAQDLLSLGAESRMNTPGVGAGNWQWRMTDHQFDQLRHHAPYLKELGWLYNRCPQPKKEDVQVD